MNSDMLQRTIEYARKEGQDFVWVYRSILPGIVNDRRPFQEEKQVVWSDEGCEACILTKELLEMRSRLDRAHGEVHIHFLDELSPKVVMSPIKEKPTAEEYLEQFHSYREGKVEQIQETELSSSVMV